MPQNHPKSPKKEKEWTDETLELFKQGLWEFVMEHCDVLPSGTIFVKFHIASRENLENRIKSRWLYHYHRENVPAKETEKNKKRDAYLAKKKEKQERYEANRKKGKQNLRWQKILKALRIRK